MSSTTFSGPVTSTGGFISGSGSIVTAAAATLTVTPALHAGRTVVLSIAATQAITLPAATATGNVYRFICSITATGDKVLTAAGSDVMIGVAMLANDAADTASMWEAATSTTITLDGSTTGGVIGTVVELHDIASAVWSVRIVGAATGTEATPFS